MKVVYLSQPEPLTIPKAYCVGTMKSPAVEAMGCLLNDGTVLTDLHAIYDFEKKCYLDVANIFVWFVKGTEVYRYRVKYVIHDGLNVYEQYPNGIICYDFARLALEGAPLKELGPGVELDPIDHFSVPYISEPRETIAVSGPRFGNGPKGLISYREQSCSSNLAGHSDKYVFSQIGNHKSAPGLSGFAIFPVGESWLYAMHRGIDKHNGAQVGFKASEYQSTLRMFSAPVNMPPRPLPPTVRFGSNLHFEALRRKGADIDDITSFLIALRDALRANKQLDPNKIKIPESLKAPHTDSHQDQHLGTRPQKSAFFEAIARSNKNPVIHALANCVNKMVSEHYQRKKRDRLNNLGASQLKQLNYVVDVGFEIGVDRDTNRVVTTIMLDGFSGASYHIYPVDTSRKKNFECIVAEDLLGPNYKARLNPRQLRA